MNTGQVRSILQNALKRSTQYQVKDIFDIKLNGLLKQKQIVDYAMIVSQSHIDVFIKLPFSGGFTNFALTTIN